MFILDTIHISVYNVIMRILSDNQITSATITATNTLSFAAEEKMQIFQLADKFKASQGNTVITVDYGATPPPINCVALCGTNISSGATMTLSYSSTAPTTPEATISLPAFSNFNQVWFLVAALQKRYWVINISDPDPQGDNGVNIGYLFMGQYVQLDQTEFPLTPTLGVISQPSTSATGQEYGSKILNQESTEFSAFHDADELKTMLDIVRAKQNIDPVLLVPFEDSIDHPLYPPRYGVLSQDTYPYPMDGTPLYYRVSYTHRETF